MTWQDFGELAIWALTVWFSFKAGRVYEEVRWRWEDDHHEKW